MDQLGKIFRKPLKTYSGGKTNAENVILHYVEQEALENAQGEKYNLLFREINLRNAQSRKVLIILKQCGNALICTMEFRKRLERHGTESSNNCY